MYLPPPQFSSSYVYSFGSYRVDKHTNKQTPLKTSKVLLYATTLGNLHRNHSAAHLLTIAVGVAGSLRLVRCLGMYVQFLPFLPQLLQMLLRRKTQEDVTETGFWVQGPIQKLSISSNWSQPSDPLIVSVARCQLVRQNDTHTERNENDSYKTCRCVRNVTGTQFLARVVRRYCYRNSVRLSVRPSYW